MPAEYPGKWRLNRGDGKRLEARSACGRRSPPSDDGDLLLLTKPYCYGLLAYRGWHGWFGELRGINRGIGLHLGQLDGILAVQPGDDEFIRQLDSGNVAIISEVNLCGIAAYRSGGM